MSVSAQIFLGLGLGIASGIFLGEIADYVNAVLDLKKPDGTLKKLYDYWVLGQFATRAQPCWSVIRNVVHWA
jgi:ABC-type amino acid transport substrate-binding protein